MIEKIRRKLVWGYTLVIVAIMIISTNIGVLALNYFMAKSYSDSLVPLLDMEITEATPALIKWNRGGIQEADIFNVVDVKELMVLEYWFDSAGRLVMSEGVTAVTSFLENKMNNWDYQDREAIKMKFTTVEGEKWYMLIMAADVYDDGMLLGKVVVGINFTPIVAITHKYITLSTIVVLVVSILAYFAGNYFARKAVKPIKVSMQKQQDFVANASHELRTPLSILLSSVDMIETDKGKALVKGMKDEILHMRELINSLLLLTQTESTYSAGFTDFDVEETIENALKDIKVVAEKKDIKVVTELALNNLKIFHGDQMKIRQLWRILLDNAVKYSPERSEVYLQISEKDKSLESKIIDHGEGIATKDLEHIFERFYRSDTARAKSEGFGLGLPIAKLIIEIHKGDISVDSIKGKGTTVTVILPL